jgi:mono/diheme cytochrome c family protein
MKRILAFTFIIAAASGCEVRNVLVAPEPGLERMLEQRRANPYGASLSFIDHRVMRTPPAGTVPRETIVDRAPFTHGVENGAYLDGFPIPLTRALILRGQDRYQIFCAACHGATGDGRSVVATKMPLVKPPTLHSERVRSFPNGRIFRLVSEGFGMMPSYSAELGIEDRWAVVAYVRALELSQGTTHDALPEAVRREAEEQLR